MGGDAVEGRGETGLEARSEFVEGRWVEDEFGDRQRAAHFLSSDVVDEEGEG